MMTTTYFARRLSRALLALACAGFWLLASANAAAPVATASETSLPERFLFEFGSWQDPADLVAAPGGLTFAPDGTLYVFDGANGRIAHLDAAGRLLATWGREGGAPGQFMPSARARPLLAPDGTLYVNDQAANRISHFDRDGTYLGGWRFGGGQVVDLALAPDGTIWALDGGLMNRTRRYTPGGQEVGELSPVPDLFPGGAKRIAVAGDGTVFLIICTLDLIRFSPDGHFEQIIAGMSSGRTDTWGEWHFTDVDVAADGTLYVLRQSYQLPQRSRVDHMTRTGDLLGSWPVLQATDPSESMVPPTDLEIAPDGTIYVSDVGGARLMHFRADGQALGNLGPAGGGDACRMNTVADLALVGDKVLALDGAGDPAVRVFSADGAYLGAWGRPGLADGAVASPLGIAALPGGSAVVVVDNAGRVQRFTVDGRYIGRIGTTGHGPGEFTTPSSVAAAPDGSIYVAEGRFVSRFDKAGVFQVRFPVYVYNSSVTLAVAPDGTLFVAEDQLLGLRRFQPDGSPLPTWGEEIPSFSPGDVAVGADGRVYAADSGERRVHVFDAAGTVLGVIQVDDPRYGSPVAPLRIDVNDQDGRAFIAPTLTQGIQVLGPAPDPHWRLSTHADRWLGGPPVTLDLQTAPDARWERGATGSARPPYGFSAVLDRNVALPPAVYAFHATATGGLRLWVGQRLLVDGWNAPATDAVVTAPVFARDIYVRLEYADNADGTVADPASVGLTWTVTGEVFHFFLPRVAR
jgi:DNA-binding beta-propeller fold protein YncE